MAACLCLFARFGEGEPVPLERRFRAQRLHRIAGDEGKRGNSNPRQCAFGNF
jgi:hypothetical protein